MSKFLIVSTKGYDSKSIYDVKEMDDKSIELNYSELSSEWCYPGKLAYTLKDTGDGYEFSDNHLTKLVTLDYCQARMIMLMLQMLDKDVTQYKVFTEDTL